MVSSSWMTAAKWAKNASTRGLWVEELPSQASIQRCEDISYEHCFYYIVNSLDKIEFVVYNLS